MMHWGVGDSHHVDLWSAYAPGIDILVGKAVNFDLTCDVIVEAKVNETWFPLTNLPEISNAA